MNSIAKNISGQPFGAASPRINLALQGGGSHGAFTWGVLDALLEDGRIELEGISGTSAGGMNAVALAHGAPAEEIGRAIEGAAARRKDSCPQCGAALRVEEGCAKCTCGYSRC